MNKDVYINMLVAITAVVLVMAMGMRLAAAAEPPTVINLTQTPCQFVESENGVDHGFQSRKKADCEAKFATAGASAPTATSPRSISLMSTITFMASSRAPSSMARWGRAWEAYSPWAASSRRRAS